MKILIIKTSSLGDIIHTFPALTDAGGVIDNIQFDWVVEEPFASVPLWHPLVKNVIPVAIRKWRKNPFHHLLNGDIKNFIKKLRSESYDAIIDAQGLIKSALITRLAKGVRIGLDKNSLTEPLARFAYQKKVSVGLSQQAIFRMRSIFSKALGYTLPVNEPNFGLQQKKLSNHNTKNLIFVHGTTWASKHWLDEYWITLAKLAIQSNFTVQLPWCNRQEQERVKKIKTACPNVHILSKMSLDELKNNVLQSKGVIGVDTGISHLAAALDIPTLTLYGPSNPSKTGALGKHAITLKSNFSCIHCDKKTCHYQGKHFTDAVCMSHLTPDLVWEKFLSL